MTTRKCSFCKSTNHSACKCDSPLLLNYLAELCHHYNQILSNITDCNLLTKNDAILITNNEFKQYLHQMKKYNSIVLNVLVRNLNLTLRLTQYDTSCLLITDYIVSRSQRNHRNLPISYGISLMVEEFFMINKIHLGIESPELAPYKDFILHHDILKSILNLKFRQSIPLEIENVYMMDTEVLEDCPICMNEITSSNKVITDCNHNYCNHCFDLMVHHSKSRNEDLPINCALCRSQISKCYKNKPIISLI